MKLLTSLIALFLLSGCLSTNEALTLEDLEISKDRSTDKSYLAVSVDYDVDAVRDGGCSS